jgi:hypothetical protein
MYEVNGRKFNSFLAAIAQAKIDGAVVTLDGNVKWSPAPKAKAKTRHFMVVDGKEIEFGKVRH